MEDLALGFSIASGDELTFKDYQIELAKGSIQWRHGMDK